MVMARRVGQKFHILRPLVRLYRKLLSPAYEEDFEKSIVSRISPGDTVWDIGANIGYYTLKFSDAAGPNGKVVAFEPSPRTFERLVSEVSGRQNISSEQIALSDHRGEAKFYYGNAVDGVTDALQGNGSFNMVQVACGDDFSPAPSVIKIDVEGFELEVLKGMPETLKAPALRNLFIEVHFLELAKRGLHSAPTEIAAILKGNGFSVRWTDPSHIVASR